MLPLLLLPSSAGSGLLGGWPRCWMGALVRLELSILPWAAQNKPQKIA